MAQIHLNCTKRCTVGLGTSWARTPTPSPKLQSTGPQRESRSVVDRRQPGEELRKWKWRTWATAGVLSTHWPVADRDGQASLPPYMPAGVTGSNDDEALYNNTFWQRRKKKTKSHLQSIITFNTFQPYKSVHRTHPQAIYIKNIQSNPDQSMYGKKQKKLKKLQAMVV